MTDYAVPLLDNSDGTGLNMKQKGTNSGAHSYLSAEIAGERNPGTSNDYLAALSECNYYVLDEADGTDVQVSSGVPALCFGYYVNEVLAGATIILQDDATPVITIPAGGGSTVGSFIPLPGIKFNTDLTANAEAALTTGNITICWRAQ